MHYTLFFREPSSAGGAGRHRELAKPYTIWHCDEIKIYGGWHVLPTSQYIDLFTSKLHKGSHAKLILNLMGKRWTCCLPEMARLVTDLRIGVQRKLLRMLAGNLADARPPVLRKRTQSTGYRERFGFFALFWFWCSAGQPKVDWGAGLLPEYYTPPSDRWRGGGDSVYFSFSSPFGIAVQHEPFLPDTFLCPHLVLPPWASYLTLFSAPAIGHFRIRLKDH